MVKWSFAFASIAAASFTSSLVSAFNSPQQQQRQRQQHIQETTLPSTTTTSISLEEELVTKLVTTADQHFGKKKRNAYRTTLENIRDSKARSQRQLERSALDKKYAEEKLAKMMAKYQAKKKQIETELEVKTIEAQKIVDEEAQSIMNNLQTKIDSEIMRESQVRSLMDFIQTAITNKESELEAEEVITGDMIKVRAKVKKGSIANQIDDVLEKKARVAAMDRKLVQDLQDLIAELKEMLERTKYRAVSLGSALARIEQQQAVAGNTRSNDDDELMMKQMEQIFTVALEETETWEKTLLVVRDWVHDMVWGKSQVLNEALPSSMKAVGYKKRADRANEEEIKKQLKHLDRGSTAIATNDDDEIVGALGEAAGKFALAGGKTAMFGIKTLIDSVIEQEVQEKEPIAPPTTTTNAMENLKGMIQSQLLKETKIADKEVSKDQPSSRQGGNASGEKERSIMSGWNAAAVLQKMKKKNKININDDNLKP